MYRFPLFLLLIILSAYSQAQIVLVVAKDKDRSAQDYKVEWGYPYHYQAKEAAQKYLANKGYTSSTDLPCQSCGDTIKEGIYVVVKTTYQTYDKKTRVSYGMGASRSSAQEAEQRAVKDLSIYDGAWVKSNGYTVVEQKEFKNTGAVQFVYIVEKTKDAQCGEYAVKYSCMAGTIENKTYDKLKKGIKENCTERKIPESDIGCFKVIKRYVAVLKCLKTCNGKQMAFYKFVEANDASELKTIAPMNKGDVFTGSGYSYFIDEMIEVNANSASMLDSFIDYVTPLLKGLNLLKTDKGGSVGIRD